MVATPAVPGCPARTQRRGTRGTAVRRGIDLDCRRGCLGSTLVKNKLTKSLRWAVANGIPVLTPQLFVGTARMCDEDSDLGLEFTLAKMLSKQGKAAREKKK